MKFKGIHHIGIAVADLEESLAKWVTLFGAVPGPVEEIPERGVRLVHLRFAEGSEIELLSPLGEASPVAKFLEKRGEGVQHFTLEVDDIQAAFRELTEAGLQFVSEGPQIGAGGAQVAFVHPKNLNGVLVEIRQGRKS
ncbi:MAG: methylmalonyl-CoA epimerase [Candidatus Aminicenantales bacterium]